MHLGRTTLSKFLSQQLHDIEGASDLGALLVDVAAAVKAIAAMTAKGALGGVLGELDQRNVQGETQKRLDVLASVKLLSLWVAADLLLWVIGVDSNAAAL